MGRVYEQVQIDQQAAGSTTLRAAADSKVCTLHRLFGTLSANGTIMIEESDGTNLTGPMQVLADAGPFEIGPAENPKFNLKTETGQGLVLTTTGGTFQGFAMVSYDDD